MGSIRDAWIPVVDKYRGYLDSVWDLRRFDLTIRTRTWVGLPGTGTSTDEDVVLDPKPLIRQLSVQEVSGSGGRYVTGDVRVGPITPEFPEGGYAPDILAPTPANKGVEIIYVVSGDLAGEYSLVALEQTSGNFHYILILRRRRSTP